MGLFNLFKPSAAKAAAHAAKLAGKAGIDTTDALLVLPTAQLGGVLVLRRDVVSVGVDHPGPLSGPEVADIPVRSISAVEVRHRGMQIGLALRTADHERFIPMHLDYANRIRTALLPLMIR